MMRIFALVLSLLFVASCSNTSSKIVTPENLIGSSSENVSFGITSDMSIDSIVKWINDDRPSSAIVSCVKGDFLCADAENILKKYNIPYTEAQATSEGSNIALVYKRVTAKDCNRGIGCSVSANIVQSVTNRADFTSPALSDYQDAAKGAQTYNNYQKNGQ